MAGPPAGVVGAPVRSALKALRQARAGVPRMSHHSLRHGFATFLYDQGYTVEQVANCLGNSIEVCHAIYVQWKNRKDKQVAAKVTFGFVQSEAVRNQNRTKFVQTSEANSVPEE